jgi:MFS family permease
MSQPLSALRSVVADPQLRRLELAAALDGATGWAYATALALLAYAHGGAAAVGAVWLLLMIPASVAGPLLAVLADGHRRERVLAAALGARGALILLAGAAALAGAPAVLVFGLAVPASMAARVAGASTGALRPALARAERLAAANAVAVQIENASSVAGPALAAGLLALFGPDAVVALAGAALLPAAALAARIRTEAPPRRAEPRTRDRLTAGASAVWADRRVRLLLVLFAVQTAAGGALNVLVVALAFDLPALGGGAAGLLNAALGLGGVAGGALVLARSARVCGDLGRGFVLMALPLAAAALWPGAAPALLALAAVGAGNAVVDATTYTLLGRFVEESVHGRLFGLVEAIAVAATGAGAVAAPLLLAAGGLGWSLAALGLVLAAAGAVALTRLHREALPDAVVAPA